MISIETINLDKIALIKPLWEKLNQIHYNDSTYFKDHYASFTFEKRISTILGNNPNDVYISIVKWNNDIAGYCISIKTNANGEIESLYLEEKIRGNGIGKQLVNDHIKWLKQHGCKRIRLAVSYGHNDVLEFYRKIGMYERLIYMELKD